MVLNSTKNLYLCSPFQRPRDVAQLASAPRSGRGGRWFESSHPDHPTGQFLTRFFISGGGFLCALVPQ